MSGDALTRAKQIVAEAMAAKKAVKVPGTIKTGSEVNSTADARKAKKTQDKKRKDHTRLICKDCGAEATPNKNTTEDWRHYDNVPCIDCGGKMTIEVGTLDRKIAEPTDKSTEHALKAELTDEELKDIVAQVKAEREAETVETEEHESPVEITRIENVEQFVQATEQQLIGNNAPVEGMMDMVANSTVAINAYMLSLVRAQAPAVTAIFNQKNKLAKEIFSDEFIKERTDSEKIGLFKLAQTSFQADMDFIQTVQDRLDISQLQAGILAQAVSTEEVVSTDSKAKDRVIDLIGKLIQQKRLASKN